MKLSKKLTLSGISAAISAIFLIIGNYVSILDYSFYLLSSLVVILPFITKEIKWGVLTFLAATGIGFIFCPNIMQMFPYFAFFGPFALLHAILDLKSVKLWLQYIIKNIFYVGVITLFYFFSQIFVDINRWNLPLWLLFVLAIIALNIYDFLIKNIYKQCKKLVIKLLNKT